MVGIAGEDDLDAPDLAPFRDRSWPEKRPAVKESGSNGVGVLPTAKPLQGPRQRMANRPLTYRIKPP